jgi:chromosome segregation ATPase
MASKTLRDYGLEFINEMAKDRKVAQQEIGVRISGAKSALTTQGLPHFSYQDIEEFVKSVREATTSIVDSELTKITIKSLGRIKQVIQSDEAFIQSVVSPETEDRVLELLDEIQLLKEQIKEKNTNITDLEKERDDIQASFEKNKDQVDGLEMEIKRLKLQSETIPNLQKQLEEAHQELGAKDALIENLKESEKIHEQDVNEALASVADTYQIQQNYFQTMYDEKLEQQKKQLEQEAELKMEEIRTRLENEIRRHEESEKQHKTTITRMEETIKQSEEEIGKLQEKLQLVYDERADRNLLLDYTQRLLSNHPLYASILILLNLGGTLDLPTMARSVGAHTVKLRQMLEELVTRGLISITDTDPPMVNAIMTQ